MYCSPRHFFQILKSNWHHISLTHNINPPQNTLSQNPKTCFLLKFFFVKIKSKVAIIKERKEIIMPNVTFLWFNSIYSHIISCIFLPYLNTCPPFILQLENGPKNIYSVHMHCSFLSLKRNSHNSLCVFLSTFICRARTARCVKGYTFMHVCVCEVRTGLWWSANILCDVLWCVCWQTWRFCTIRSADVSISPFCIYRSHIINSINVFLWFFPLWHF